MECATQSVGQEDVLLVVKAREVQGLSDHVGHRLDGDATVSRAGGKRWEPGFGGQQPGSHTALLIWNTPLTPEGSSATCVPS